MSARPPRTPSYRHHKPSGQAVVTLNGRDVYLGAYDSRESRAEYDRVVAEWLANGRHLPGEDDITIAELVARYAEHVRGQYRSDEPDKIGQAIRPVRIRYGTLPAREFSPLKLKTIRQELIARDLVRSQINKRVRRIVGMFRWAVAEELIPVAVHQSLKAVDGLRKGRANVRESKPVRPVPDAWIDPILPHLNRQVRAMVELQRLTGMRPGEVTVMRTGDINTAGRIWTYQPASHKTAHLDRERAIQLGPRAQEILRPWLRTNLEEHLFQPREAMAERREARRAARKSKVQPSQLDRSKARPKKRPGDRYDSASYRRAIVTAIEKANQDRTASGEPPIPRWHPHQIRHSLGTAVRREFGLDAARAVLGHSTPVVTEIYAELDRTKAADVMSKIG